MPAPRSTPRMLHRAWKLRQQMTPAESELWGHLRALREKGIHFRRQHAIGPYVADFCAPGIHLVIELHGSQHLEQEEQDRERTAYLRAHGYEVIRFWNDQVMNNIQGVMQVIERAVGRK